MESGNRRTYYVQKPPDIQKMGANVLSPTASLFSTCFMVKANSLIDDSSQDDLISSQQTEVTTFCDALRILKETFCLTDEPSSEQVLGQLKETNALLAEALKQSPALYSKDILQMATLVNSKIKGYFASSDPETKMKLSDVILCAIDKLSIAFDKSLSGSSFGAFHRTESFENLCLDPSISTSSCLQDLRDNGDEVDGILLTVTSGIDKALAHAASWLDSARFIMTYIEKRSSLELDLAKHLMKLAMTSQQNMRGEKLPLQLAYHAAFTLDAEIADGIHRFNTIIQTEKFLQPLSLRCAEHKKLCKDLKDLWSKEERQMREATENLRKSKVAYNARCRELMKLKEATQRVIADSNVLNDANGLIRLEKRRKMEEEAVVKVTSTQEQYQKCIDHANDTRVLMNAAKKKILADIRQLVDESDRILKMATIDYFTLMATRTTAIPLQFQALRKSSERYEPGSVYAQYAELLSISSNASLQDEEPFVFQLYSPSIEDQDKQFSYMKRIQEFRKRISPLQEILHGEDLDTKRLLSDENSEAAGYSVSRSLDSSPVRSRRYVGQGHRKLTNSSSFDGLTDLNDDKDCFTKSDCRDFDDVRIVRGLIMSKVAQMHEFKRLRTFSRCRQCDCYIYFNGFECSLCGLSCHKLCLRNLRWECGHLKSRSPCRRSRSERRPLAISQKGLPDRVPYVVKKCIEQIDANGLEVKGIFRVSAVKSRVEALCQKLESEDETFDLSSESPHTIAGLIRLYLRQLEEPLIAFQTCEELVNLVKNSNQTENNVELIEQMKSLLSCLPGENFWTLSCLVHHLKRVAQFSEVNLMSATNLAVVFGPTLIRMSSNDAVAANSLVDVKHQCSVVELLITHAKEIFGLDPIPSSDLNSEDSPDSATNGQAMAEASSVGDRLNSSVASESEGSCRSTTVWFDQNVYNEPRSHENVTGRSSQGFSRLVQSSDDSDDDDNDNSSRPSSDSISSYPSGFDSSARLLRDDLRSAENSEAAAQSSSSFQRMRAYSPQFHRRINNVSVPVKRETFQCQKPYSMDSAAKSTKSANNSNVKF